MLVVFAGLPGTGKTTLARRLSESLGSVYLRIDAIEHAIRTADSPGHEVGDVGYRVGYAMAQASLCAGRIVVADSVNPVQESRDAWCAAASECGVKVVEIEVICSDPMEHRRRVERRVADIPGFVLPTWEAVTAREYHPWTRERLVVDTAGRAVEQCLSELIERLDGHPDCSELTTSDSAKLSFGAFAIILDGKARVLLSHRIDRDAWNLPGGRVEPEETPREAVVREVEEETGLKVRVDQLLGVYAVPSNQDLVFSFSCACVGGLLRVSNEADAHQWFDPADIPVSTLPRHAERIADAYSGRRGAFLRVQT